MASFKLLVIVVVALLLACVASSAEGTRFSSRRLSDVDVDVEALGAKPGAPGMGIASDPEGTAADTVAKAADKATDKVTPVINKPAVVVANVKLAVDGSKAKP